MKYSQFLEAQTILEIQGLSLGQVKDKSYEELNEFFGINKAIKSMVSKGVWGTKLQTNKDKLSADLSNQVKRSIAKLVDAKKNSQGENNKLKNQKIESEIVKIINNLSNKLIELKTTELHRRIEENKQMKQGAKDALKYSWEVMTTEIKVDILSELLKDKVITDDSIITKVKTAVKEKDIELKNKGKEIEKQLGGDGEEGEGEGEGASTTKEVDAILGDKDVFDQIKDTLFK